MKEIKNYIGGEFVVGSGQSIPIYEPASGEQFAYLKDGGPVLVGAAVDAASSAFALWSKTSAIERHDFLHAIASGIERRFDEFVAAESKDNGKTLALAKAVDIPRAIANFKYFAAAALQFSSESYNSPSGPINYVLRQPLGVVACISPWNLPLYLLTWKIAPALATGNTVVAKPSEITPYTAYLLSEVVKDAELPPGVLNIIHGSGAAVGGPLSEHKDVKAMSFTGSTRTGKIIAEKVGPQFKKMSLEMGGKNANIIFADCNYEKMLKKTMHSSFSNQGQICLCGSRILIQKEISDRFITDFVEKTKKLKVGHPSDKETKIGAVVSKEHLEKIMSYIEMAKEEGGQILCGGNQFKLDAPYDGGYYVEPTIIVGLDNNSRCNQEEIFGPVVTIQSFETEDQAIALANDTDYGLAFSLWTENTSKAHRVASELEAGIVWINSWMIRDLRTPFGGVKNSGVGREGGMEVMRFFTEEKNVCIDYGD